MSHLSLAAKQDEEPMQEAVVQYNKPSNYEKATHKLSALKLGAVVIAFVFFGGLCAEFGLALASLLTGGVCAVLLPVAIYWTRNQKRFEEKFMRRLLNVPDAENETLFETEYRFFATKTGLQLFVKSDFPRFAGEKFLRVIYDDVPNGILYEIKDHTFDAKCVSESMELVVVDEPLAKAWDKKLRNKLILNLNMNIEVAFRPKSDSN